jgi:hypothetical protein
VGYAPTRAAIEEGGYHPEGSWIALRDDVVARAACRGGPDDDEPLTLDWDALLGFLAARGHAGLERVEGSSYRRTIVLEGQPGIIELCRGDDDRARGPLADE